MWRPSLSLILSGVFLGYIAHSIYTLSLLFVAPPCQADKTCFRSYLKDNPALELHLFSSSVSWPNVNQVQRVHSIAKFNYTQPYTVPVVMKIPSKSRNNGSLYLHIVVVPRSSSSSRSFYELLMETEMSYARMKMTQLAVPQAEAFNLLGESKPRSEDSPKKNGDRLQKVSHLRSKVTFTMMTDDIQLPLDDIPMELRDDIKVTRDGTFLPIIKYDFLQMRHNDLVRLSNDSKTINVTIMYAPVSLEKLRLVLHVEAATQGLLNLGFSDKDVDEAKGIFAGTNIYLLAGTILISSMHLLFDFLAFKNDISFWRSKKSLQGLSTTTIVWRAFSQAIVFLYLLDEGSSLLVLVPAGISTIIEFWKSKKVLRLEITRGGGGSLLPKIKIKSGDRGSTEAKTREFDAESMRYLSYLLYPLVIGGAVYSLLYQPHKSWYSWSINSMVKGVYAFGFLFMLPQLFVNYKLKSVAHLPWRSFMYKAFNTFIDDVFAFMITMPVAHRVACFRDDAVFLVYLYQRWLYPVDKSRRETDTIIEDPGGSTGLLAVKKNE